MIYVRFHKHLLNYLNKMNSKIKTLEKITKRNFTQKTNKNPLSIASRILQYKKTITTVFCGTILLKNNLIFMPLIFGGISVYYFIKEGNHSKAIQNMIDKSFTGTKNVRILLAME